MEAVTETDTRGGVLAAARVARRAELEATAAQLRWAAEWAAMHSVDSIDQAAAAEIFGETVIPIAGPGAPLVGEFCVAELAAALGMPTDHGRWLLGEALELKHRLRRLWTRVMALDLPAWRARRIARATMHLSPDAADFVDRQIAHVAHRVGTGVLERLIDEAIAQFMPETAAEQAAAAADGRHFTVDHRQVSFAGTSKVYGELDLADALDLDAAVTARAAHLADLGSPLGLDGRRAAAVGEIARADLTLDLTTGDEAERTEPARPVRGTRETVLYLHLPHDALTGPLNGRSVVGRVQNTGYLVTAEQIREWCGQPFTKVVVKPVLDLDSHVHVGSYEVPDRLAEQVDLRDGGCVFPWCTRPARAAWFQTVPEAWAAATRNPRPVPDVMADFAAWVMGLGEARHFVASPLGFDGDWIDFYLRRFTRYAVCQGPYETERLFHGPGVCLLSLACGITGGDPATFSVHDLPKEWFGDVPHTHEAIDDARGYAHLLVELLRRRATA